MIFFSFFFFLFEIRGEDVATFVMTFTTEQPHADNAWSQGQKTALLSNLGQAKPNRREGISAIKAHAHAHAHWVHTASELYRRVVGGWQRLSPWPSLPSPNKKQQKA